MNYKKTKSFILFIITLSSCSPSLNYIGNSYKPTTDVSLYFTAKDIALEYKVIGLLSFEFAASIINKESDYSVLVLKKAKEVGADAVLITNFSSRTKEVISEDILTKKIAIDSNTNLHVEAKFLKYKK